jgi:ribosome maturation protein Sdo1
MRGRQCHQLIGEHVQRHVVIIGADHRQDTLGDQRRDVFGSVSRQAWNTSAGARTPMTRSPWAMIQARARLARMTRPTPRENLSMVMSTSLNSPGCRSD